MHVDIFFWFGLKAITKFINFTVLNRVHICLITLQVATGNLQKFHSNLMSLLRKWQFFNGNNKMKKGCGQHIFIA